MRRISFIGLVAGLAAVATVAGCMGAAPAGVEQGALGAAPQESGADKYGLGWVKADDGDNPFVIRADLVIDAPPAVVWSLVRDPNHYQDFNRALTAHVDQMVIGAPISLDIRLFGDDLPPTNSQETVAIFDESLYVASWDRDFGLGQLTHRPQLVEAEGTGTHYYTALQLPKSFGWLVAPTFGPGIHDAFTRFAEGLRAAALARK
jgi:hypothetical protein